LFGYKKAAGISFQRITPRALQGGSRKIYLNFQETLGYCARASGQALWLAVIEEGTMTDESIKIVRTDTVTREEFEDLKNEVHLVKVSIKKLLVDLREKLNDLDSPLRDIHHTREPPSDPGTTAPVQIFMGSSPKHQKFRPPVVRRERRKK
jgi:hypothetical protein